MNTVIKLLQILALMALVASCRSDSDTTHSALPKEIDAAWHRLEEELDGKDGTYSLVDSYDGAYTSEFIIKKLGDNWSVHCLKDGGNASGAFTGSIQVRTPDVTFGVKDNSAMTESGNPYSLSYAVAPGEPLTSAQTGLLERAHMAVFGPIQCEKMTSNDLKKARSITVEKGAFPDHPGWIKLTFKDFSEPVSPWGRDEDPIVARAGRIVLDPEAGYPMVAREFDIEWRLNGKLTENVRKQRIEYIDGLDHFIVYGEWEGPVSRNMVQKNELKKIGGIPSAEEFTLAHYGIEYSVRNTLARWLMPVLVGITLLVIITIGFRWRRYKQRQVSMEAAMLN